MSYNQEYGGGGSSGSNYYDQNASFDDSRRGGNDEYRDTRYTGPDSYSGGDDFSSASHHAQEHHSSEDKSLFDNALSFLQDRKGSLSHPDNVEVDERHAMHSHQALYGGGGESQSHDSGSVGAGAAVQALKMFTSGGSSDGGMDKNKLIGLAMAQAGKLWDEKQGSGASMSGDKQSAVNNAAEMALKMYMKGGGGLGGSGGPSGLLGLASKFL